MSEEPELIYMDNAATTWPKPPGVREAVAEALDGAGNPGRSGHALALRAARWVLAAREGAARLVGAADPARIAFTRNATEAVNLALGGLLRPGDRVVTTATEHNAVMRPLRHLERTGVELCVVPSAADGTLDLAALQSALAPGARLLVAAHASNVLGTIQPLDVLGRAAHAAGALFLVDGAQTAGAVPLDLSALPVDLLAFTGHKGLLGPQGTGGLYVRPGLEIAPMVRGGTGSASESEEQPEFAPDRYESGTPNVPGLAGLAAAAAWLADRSVAAVRAHELDLTRRLLDGATAIPGVQVYGPADPARRTGLVSLNLAGVSPAALGQALEEGYGILTRIGLHCAPAAHRTAGTYPDGSVRFSFSPLTTAAEVDTVVDALAELARAAT